ncbi:hypothetical protein ACWEGE_10285 [Amycolatopsis sp. NPDC004747]
MCRSTSDGGRRCTGSSKARARALGTARKAVERARHTLNQARATGDPAAVNAAEAKLTAAQQHLDDTRAAHPHTPAAGQPQGHDTGEAPATPEDTTADTGSATDAAHNETAAHHRDTTAQTTSHIGLNSTTFTNYAAPGATVGLQAHTVTGATVVMGGGPAPAGMPDQVRNLHGRVQSAMAAGRYTAHHSDDITEPGPGTNTAGAGERVAFQVGTVHRRDNT